MQTPQGTIALEIETSHCLAIDHRRTSQGHVHEHIEQNTRKVSVTSNHTSESQETRQTWVN